MSYTTRDEAIYREIVEPIENGDVNDAAAEYDIDAIADEVLGSYSQGFACQVTPEDFWDVVARYAY